MEKDTMTQSALGRLRNLQCGVQSESHKWHHRVLSLATVATVHMRTLALVRHARLSQSLAIRVLT